MLNDLMKNPFTAVLVIILALVAVWLVLKLAVSLFWILVLAVIVLYFVNPSFKNQLTRLFRAIFK
jgi:hypothetical protein